MRSKSRQLKFKRSIGVIAKNSLHDQMKTFSLSYNPAGTISQIIKSYSRSNQQTIGRSVYNFGYDELDRLTSATGEPNFVYDELGNQLQRGGQFNNLNQILEDNEFTYTYTTNGELAVKTSKISGERTEYTWDDWGKQTQAKVFKTDGSVKFNVLHKYDGFERRISKTSNGSTTKFFYHGEDIIAEYSSDDKLLALYLHGPGIDDPIAMVRDENADGEFSSNEVFFYAKDHLGSVHALVDINGKVVQRYTYSAYGRTRVEKINESDKLIKNPYAYTGREWEQETGDYFNRMRFYNPYSQKFLSEDPIEFLSGDTNLYRYVENNPLGSSDPSGLSGLTPPRWYHFNVPNSRMLAKDPPKSIVSRYRAYMLIRSRMDQIEKEAGKLRSSQCQEDKNRYNQLSIEYDALYNQMWEELNIFNDLKEPNPDRML